MKKSQIILLQKCFMCPRTQNFFWSGNCVWNVTSEIIHGIKLPPPVEQASSYFDLQKMSLSWTHQWHHLFPSIKCSFLSWKHAAIPYQSSKLVSADLTHMSKNVSTLLFLWEVSSPWIALCSHTALSCVFPLPSSVNDEGDREDTCPETPLTERQREGVGGGGRHNTWWEKYTTRQQTCRNYHLQWQARRVGAIGRLQGGPWAQPDLLRMDGPPS